MGVFFNNCSKYCKKGLQNLSKIALGFPGPGDHTPSQNIFRGSPGQTTDESGYRYGRTGRDRSHSSDTSRF